MQKISEMLKHYDQLKDVHQFRLVLDAAMLFLKLFPNGVQSESELDLGIELLRKLSSVTMVTSLHQYEFDEELQKEILFKKVAVFRLCIPDSHKELRGLTETLVGMKEGEMDSIIPTLE